MGDQNTIVLVCVLVLCIWTIYQSISHHIELKREKEAYQDLLNRLMARDFPSYVAGVASLEKSRKTLKREESAEAELPANDGLGMPVT